MIRPRSVILSSLSSAAGLLTSGLLFSGVARAAELQEGVDYGATGAVMNLYVPDTVDSFPAVLVSLHYCTGTASAAANWFRSSADGNGFIVIAPGLPEGDADGCWDVGSSESLRHNGGSHSKAIVDMVRWVIETYGADPARVYAAGASSGAMMTNVLLGAYPDVFAGGSVLAGVPFGCWTAGDGWTSACANGETEKTAEEWGELVRSAYEGYSGTRPRVQLFHGGADETLNSANLAEEVKQWTNVLGLSDEPTTTEEDTPKDGWTRTRYQDGSGTVMLEVVVGEGQPHDLTSRALWGDVIDFLDLDQDVAPASAASGTGGAGQDGAAGGPSAAPDQGGDDDSGCSVSAATGSWSSVGWGVALVAAGLVVARRTLRRR